MGEIIGNSDSCNWQASVGWALAAHAFHTLRQPETRSGCLGASVLIRVDL